MELQKRKQIRLKGYDYSQKADIFLHYVHITDQIYLAKL